MLSSISDNGTERRTYWGRRIELKLLGMPDAIISMISEVSKNVAAAAAVVDEIPLL